MQGAENERVENTKEFESNNHMVLSNLVHFKTMGSKPRVKRFQVSFNFDRQQSKLTNVHVGSYQILIQSASSLSRHVFCLFR